MERPSLSSFPDGDIENEYASRKGANPLLRKFSWIEIEEEFLKRTVQKELTWKNVMRPNPQAYDSGVVQETARRHKYKYFLWCDRIFVTDTAKSTEYYLSDVK